MVKLRFFVILCFLSLPSSWSVYAIDKEIIRISTLHHSENLLTIASRIKEAYKDIGYETEIITMPAKRSLHEAVYNSNIDAELIRAPDVQSILTDFIKVPAPLFNLTLNGYSYTELKPELTWETVGRHRPVIIRGLVGVELRLKKLNIEYVAVTSTKQALEMLQTNRADIAILPKVLVDAAIQLNGDFKSKISSYKLEEILLYHYIHQRHKEIVPALTKSIKNKFSAVE